MASAHIRPSNFEDLSLYDEIGLRRRRDPGLSFLRSSWSRICLGERPAPLRDHTKRPGLLDSRVSADQFVGYMGIKRSIYDYLIYFVARSRSSERA